MNTLENPISQGSRYKRLPHFTALLLTLIILLGRPPAVSAEGEAWIYTAGLVSGNKGVWPGEPDEYVSGVLLPKGTHVVKLSYTMLFDNYCTVYSQPLEYCAKGYTVRLTLGNQQLYEEIATVSEITSPPWEPLDGITYQRNDSHTFDVSALTANSNQQLTLTVRAEPVGILWINPFWLWADATADVEIRLTNTDAAFLPRNADDLPATHGCPPSTVPSGCYQHYQVTVTPATITGKIRFELLDTSALPGHSTNKCFNDDCTDPKDSQKDYRFEASKQVQAIFDAPTNDDQIIETTADDLNSASVVVTSRDYGGTAWIRATLVIDGQEIPATVRETFFPFAMLPIDEDQDGIADAWEMEKQPDVGVEPNDDNEAGHSAQTSPRGDGLTASDEYRGFHALDPDTGDEPVVHVRTEPVDRLDVFYWDSSTSVECGQASLGPKCFHSSLHDILAPQTPFIQYWPVNGVQAWAINPTSALAGMTQFNHNSPGARRAYALAYANASLGANCGGSPPFGGPVGDAGSGDNDGTPTRIDLAQIQACGVLKSFPRNVYLAQVVAHETGHKFSRGHPARGANHTVVSPVTNLNLDQYMRDPGITDRLYVRYRMYPWQGINEIAEEVAPVYNLAGLRKKLNQFVQTTPVGDPDAVVAVTVETLAGLPGTIPTTPNNILIFIQEEKLMDWTPRFTLQNLADWSFATRDLDALNVKPPQQ